MSTKFIINTKDGLVELEYNDVKTKKLIKLCDVKPVKGLLYASYVFFIVGILVFVYDFFKDIGRKFSSTKDLFNGKDGGVAKLVGFTKGNISRAIAKFVLIAAGIISGYLSTSMAERICISNPILLEMIEPLIKYNDQGIPIEIVKEV